MITLKHTNKEENMNLISIKIIILIMFLTGILQWDVLVNIIEIKWENLRIISVLHVFLSLLFAIFILIPFVNKHTYFFIIEKKVNSLNGWILGVTLLLNIFSGFYLFFVGNTGGDALGILSFNIHLYSSFIVLIQFYFHIKKVVTKTVLQSSLLLFTLLFIPKDSYSQVNVLSNLQLDNKDTVYHTSDWTNSTKCKTCHEKIFDQWADSNHKNMVESNPYYMVLETLAAEVEGEEFRLWCMSCHNPSALTTGLKSTGHTMDMNTLSNMIYEKKAKTLVDKYKKEGQSRLEEGVSCLTCHRISKADARGNASYTINLKDQNKYPFEASSGGIKEYFSQKFINAKPQQHKKDYSRPLYKSSEYCASCHDETSPITNKKIVATYQEWKKSPYNNPLNKSENKTCITCHMTNLKDGEFSALEGYSTTGGELKKDVKVHYFSGANHFLSGLKSKEHENQTLQLLRTSAKLDLDIKDNIIKVGVTNIGAGHHLPTGVADFRELWLDITIKDARDKIIFSSGKLKKDGNLKKDARPFMKVFGDKNGKPVGLLFWKYEKLLSDTRIPAKARRVESYTIKNKNIVYPIKAQIKLNFRVYPQWVTSIVQKAYPALPNPRVVTLNKLIKIFEK